MNETSVVFLSKFLSCNLIESFPLYETFHFCYVIETSSSLFLLKFPSYNFELFVGL